MTHGSNSKFAYIVSQEKGCPSLPKLMQQIQTKQAYKFCLHSYMPSKEMADTSFGNGSPCSAAAQMTDRNEKKNKIKLIKKVSLMKQWQFPHGNKFR